MSPGVLPPATDGGPVASLDGGPGGPATPDAQLIREDAGTAQPSDAGGPGAPLRIAVVSDLNGAYGTATYEASVHGAIDRILALGPDLVLSTGDMVAGQQAGLDYDGMWAGFHAAVSDRLEAAGIPFAITPGNHDASGYASYAEERAIFIRQWEPVRRPAVDFVDGSDFPLRYSFTMGNALFVSLDATTVGPLSAEQRDWVEEQLTLGSDRAVKIVFGHVPLYPFAIGRETEILGDGALERILVAHGVTAMISGHHHAYYPGKRGALRTVGMACLGAGPRSLIGTAGASPQSFLWIEIEDADVRVLEAYTGPGFGTVIARPTLPMQVGSGEMVTIRDDL